jgi:nucleoside-diphosphate-sugar epimerase
MRLPRLRTVLLAPLILFAALYVFLAIKFAVDDDSIATINGPLAPQHTIAIFGATGTAGDGLLKAALADPQIKKIHVITRRMSPRIEEGVASGKVEATLHMDYLDYSSVREQIADANAIFWAIGISSVGVDEEDYVRIHVDFPMQLVSELASVSNKPDISFHYISSSDISADSSAMWARVKVRAEKALISFADGSNLRVIAYRPDYIGPTPEETILDRNFSTGFSRL